MSPRRVRSRFFREDLRARLDAYCAGVNRYIEQCGKKLPWEFRLLRHQPEPWRAEDTLTIGKGLALLLSTALYSRLNFFAVAEKLGDQPAKLQALFPGYPAGAPVIARATVGSSASRVAFLNRHGGWREIGIPRAAAAIAGQLPQAALEAAARSCATIRIYA